MAGIYLPDLKRAVVGTALAAIGLATPAAINLVTGTAIVESECTYLKQGGGGPALGFWQMEPATEQDCWNNYLFYEPDLAALVRKLLVPGDTTPQLLWNMQYAAAMCRIKYRRAPEALPGWKDAAGMAELWKNCYNSVIGAGVVDAAHIAAFQAAIDA